MPPDVKMVLIGEATPNNSDESAHRHSVVRVSSAHRFKVWMLMDVDDDLYQNTRQLSPLDSCAQVTILVGVFLSSADNPCNQFRPISDGLDLANIRRTLSGSNLLNTLKVILKDIFEKKNT